MQLTLNDMRAFWVKKKVDVDTRDRIGKAFLTELIGITPLRIVVFLATYSALRGTTAEAIENLEKLPVELLQDFWNAVNTKILHTSDQIKFLIDEGGYKNVLEFLQVIDPDSQSEVISAILACRKPLLTKKS